MHCYLGNLITIAERFCKISKKSAVIPRCRGSVVASRPSSSLCFLGKLLMIPLRLPDLWVGLRAALAAAPLCSQGKAERGLLRLPAPTPQPALAACGWRGNGREEEGRKKKTLTKKTHYCRPDGNIPHDQTNQSPRWGAGATQPCSNTPFHSLSGTNTWSPINGTPRTWGGGSLEPYWSMPDDFIITHHFIHWRIQTSILITFPRNRSCCAY